jgi:hypothetical protein
MATQEGAIGMANSGSSTGNTGRFRSVKFNCDVRTYDGYVIVPIDAIGSRGGAKRFYEIWSGDQTVRYNRKVATLAQAKALIDTGSYPR